MKNQHYVCLIDYTGAGDFFLRVARADTCRQYTFVTTVPSVVIKAKQASNVTTHFVSRLSPKGNRTLETFERCKELGLKFLTLKSAEQLARRIFYQCDKIISLHGDVVFLLWNGDSIMGEVARVIKAEGRAKTLFCEIANLPGKLFADSEGVNMRSSLFRTPDKVMQYADVESFDFNAWSEEFTKSKLSPGSGEPPQAKLSQKLSLFNFMDFVIVQLIGYRFFSYQAILNKLKISRLKKAFKKKLSKTPTPAELPKEEFVFFPMQVSSDTQIVLNSNYDNLQALDYLVENFEGPFVIKPHPAEGDIGYIYDYLKKISRNDIYLVFDNTYRLIQQSKEVFVINSTVGFEAMLMNKKVTFIGETLYKSLKPEQIKYYVGAYLVNIDFFSHEPISNRDVQALYQRLE
tara:strand:- start:252 stop:1463 length:1212 start_codon:yes stop_codon:yes gene_type:complete